MAEHLIITHIVTQERQCLCANSRSVTNSPEGLLSNRSARNHLVDLVVFQVHCHPAWHSVSLTFFKHIQPGIRPTTTAPESWDGVSSGFLTDLYLTLTFLNSGRGHRIWWLVLFAGPTTIFGLLGVIYFHLQPFFFFLFNLIGNTKQNSSTLSV